MTCSQPHNHTTTTMPNKDQYTSQEFRELIKTPQKQLKAKKVKDLSSYLCTYGGKYQPTINNIHESLDVFPWNQSRQLESAGFFSPDIFDQMPEALGTRPAFAISLPGIGPSLNQIWSKSLSVRELYKIKKSWKMCTWLWLKDYNKEVLLEKYVGFFVGQFGHDRKMYDSLNLAATAKMIEDALCKMNPLDGGSTALIDDGPRFIESMTCIPTQTRHDIGTWSHLFLYQIG